MSASASPATQIASSPRSAGSRNRWIISPLWDQLLIVSTPLLIVPIVFLLASPRVGVEVDTIALVVTAFFALGHHLPGMLRAYGDKELFHRFRLRFILTPLTFAAVSYPLYRYHYDFFLILL